MGQTRMGLLAVGLTVLLTDSAFAQYGPLGRMSSVQPGMPAMRRPAGQGPYGGAYAVLPPQLNALGSPHPTSVITSPPLGAGPFRSGFSSFQPFGFAPSPFFGPFIPGNGTPFVSSPQFGVNVAAFPGAGVLVNTGQFAPSSNLTVVNVVQTPPAVNPGAGFDRFLGSLSPTPGVVGLSSGVTVPRPAASFAPVALPSSPTTSSPAFARFFAGLPGAVPANGVQSTSAPR